MSDSFLHSIASIYRDNIENDAGAGMTLAEVLFVFPNRRAGLFFRKEYCSAATHATFAPNVTDINRLCQQLTRLQTANDIELLMRLYESYRYVYSSQHAGEVAEMMTFDEFVSQGTMLLADFDEVDKYLVKAEELFCNIKDLNELTISPNYFSESQIEAIQSFWRHTFVREEDEKLSFKRQFTSFWGMLYPIYTHFRGKLAEEGLGYMGMMYRDVVKNRLREGEAVLPYKRIVFVGFNMLTASEYAIFSYFKKRGIADFYFDYPTQYDGQSPFASTVAALYADNLRSFPSLYRYDQPTEVRCADMDIYRVSSASEQSRIAAREVHRIYTENGGDAEGLAASTAILLADEGLLTGVLQSLPAYVKELNVTMGYPLAQSPIANLISNLIGLQTEYGNQSFYHKPLINILTHPYVQHHFRAVSTAMLRHITRYNYIRITAAALHEYIRSTDGVGDEEKEFFVEMLSPQLNTGAMFAYLHRMLDRFMELSDAGGGDDRSHSFEVEYVVQYRSYLGQLEQIVSKSGIEVGMSTFSMLINRLTANLKVQFAGEPLQGLQVMGMLESRLLDFDNLILLGFNDVNIPGTRLNRSVIPYSLRRGYGLPTYENSDAIQAYNFYRTVYRARHITVVSVASGNDNAAEISRYYHQIRHLLPVVVPGVRIREHSSAVRLPEGVDEEYAISIEKTDEIMAEMERYRSTAALSASRLKDYIACPLKFYMKSVLHVNEVDEVQEHNNAPLLGLVFHKAMELYYDMPGYATVDRGMIKGLVTRAFEALKERKRGLEITGFNHLIFNVACNFVEVALRYDAGRPHFTYMASEETVTSEIDGVNLNAIIDRTDRSDDGMINIIDYKTTRQSPAGKCLLMNLINSANSADHEIFQILLYCYIYRRNRNCEAGVLRPNIYNLYSLSRMVGGEGDLQAFDDCCIRIHVPQSLIGITAPLPDVDVLKLAEDETEEVEVRCYADIQVYFETVLHGLFKSIYDRDVPFVPKADSRSCLYCQYRMVCNPRI